MIEEGYFEEAQKLARSEYISNSKIRTMLDSPAMYFAKYGEGYDTGRTQAMVDGEILHEAVLRPESFHSRCEIHTFKDFRTNAAKEWRENTLKEKPGCFVMSREDKEDYEKIIQRVMLNNQVREIIGSSAKEMHGYAKHPETGRWLYSRPDAVTDDGIILELKFVESSEPRRFLKQQFYEGWYLQLGFYSWVGSLINKAPREQSACYVAVEKKYPHISQVYTISSQFEKMAKIKIDQSIERIETFMKLDPMISNRSMWPGYSESVLELGPTYSMLSSDDDFTDLIQIGGM